MTDIQFEFLLVLAALVVVFILCIFILTFEMYRLFEKYSNLQLQLKSVIRDLERMKTYYYRPSIGKGSKVLKLVKNEDKNKRMK